MIEVTQHINTPQKIKREDVVSIENLLQEFPYFQTAQLLLSKGLLNMDSIRYNRQLKKAAAYSLDRKQLFKLITQNKVEQQVISADNNDKQNTEQDLAIGQPLAFEKEEEYSFSEWLALSKVKKIDRTPKPSTKQLIDNFIDKKVSISKPKKTTFFKPVDVAKESLVENNDLVTPTLAKVYLEQGHYDKAISAYEKLCLKYPEKNSLFANQIKLINKLKEK
jgi:tetratricopeptide (TPR) repeat protein